MRVNVDLFVQLKKGTISDYYITGEVLGEGFFKLPWIGRRFWEGVEGNPPNDKDRASDEVD